jgi:hypothetical protein
MECSMSHVLSAAGAQSKDWHHLRSTENGMLYALTVKSMKDKLSLGGGSQELGSN